MNGSETIEDLKSLIFQSFDELGFGNRCGLLFAEIGNDLKAEERKCRKITKSLNESASMLEGVMKDIRAGEMEESEDDTRSIPSVSISDGFDIGDDEIMVVDDDPVAQLRYARGRPPLRMSFGQQQQNVSSGQHASLRNESGQYTRVVGVPVNASNQQMYYVGAGDANQHLSSTAPCFFRVMTVLNQPSPRPPELAVGMKLYARRHDNWSKGALVEIQNRERPFSERKFKIKFDGRGMKVVGSKGIAYTDHPKDNLLVGSRVIALYKDDERSFHSFYVGIIAEPPSLRNNNRYLVFFDDGYAQYSVATHLHQVCDQSKQVWEDIHPDSQEFIRSYLQQYPERPMVRLYPGQTIKTEWNGDWWVAHVQEVDASLVKMYFDFDKRVEWIYRGSTRLEPLYTELANAEASKQMGKGRRRNNLNNPKGSRKPFVEYTRCLEDPDPKKQMSYPMAADPPGDVQKPAKAAVAKKSTSKLQGMTVLDTPKQPPVVGSYDEQQNSFGYNNRTDRRLPNNRGNDSTESGAEGPLGAFVEIDRDQFVRKESLHKVRMPRSCSMLCLREVNDDPAAYKLKNPLLIPLYYFWERQVTKQRNNLKRGICYRAPCGRVLRSLIELDHYLMETNSKLTIDQFCFDPILRIDVEYIPVKTFCDIKDLSYGKENVPISCVNGIDRQYPDYVEYSNQRIPAKGVQLCLEEGFLVGCDCTDGCRDRSKCRCIQMTVEATSWSSGGRDEEAGYKFRRLQEPLLTGVFECNSRCRCDSRCHNRVVQHGLTLRLQVFKTDSRGWGLRCLDDIPAGGFICIYAGQLLTDEGANEDGKQYGDEYLAELDYMETVEKTKEGYESDICISEDSSSRSSRCSFGEAELNRDTDRFLYFGYRKAVPY